MRPAWPASAALLALAAACPAAADEGAGRAAYERYCADCHHMELHGTGHGPELTGPGFLSRWENHSTTELLDYISMLMPAGTPGSLSRADYRNVLAYMLLRNGAPPGGVGFDPESPVRIGAVLQG
ncbi:MAG: hypothetical protein GWN54_08365, partial [Gammaproteobacteria bacterium]|nr:hypothetical protein [Gammaproteobacteria bacterium]